MKGAGQRLSGAGIWSRSLGYVIVQAGILAWVVTTSSVVAGCWLAYLDGLGQDREGPVGQALFVAGLRVLWIPAKLSDQLLGMAGLTPHSPQDVLANVVAYSHETLLVSFVVFLLVVPLCRVAVWKLRAAKRSIDPGTTT